MKKTALRGASLVLAIALALGVFTPGQATSQTLAFMPNETINLAFFYKPPSNSNAATVAANFNSVVLTGGDETFRNSLAANGFTSTIPQYYRSEGIQDPGGCTASSANNQIANRAGDFCWISQNHPDWFLLDTNGNRMKTSPTSNYYRMDPGSDGWRNFFVTRLLDTQQQKGWSGLFLDNVEASLSEIQRDGLMPAKYPDNASYQDAVRGFLQYLYQNYSLPYNRPVIGNIIARQDDATWYSYNQYMSGAMQERWSVAWSSTDYLSENKWKSDLALAEQTQSQGKYIILVAPGNKTDTNRQNFAFASYLLISNGMAAFRYADEDYYREVWLYNNYNVDLGTPLGARYQTGTSWRRDFTKGYVIVDPVNRMATISTSPMTAPTATTIPTQAPTITPTFIQNTPVPSTPTTASGFTATPAAMVTIYDDKNSAFKYSGSWSNVTDSKAYQGSFKLTQKLKSSVTLNFSGQSFTIIYKTGPLFGKMDVYVDGQLVHSLDQKTSTPLFQQRWSYPGALTAGQHQLKLIYSSPSNARVSLDAVSIP